MSDLQGPAFSLDDWCDDMPAVVEEQFRLWVAAHEAATRDIMRADGCKPPKRAILRLSPTAGYTTPLPSEEEDAEVKAPRKGSRWVIATRRDGDFDTDNEFRIVVHVSKDPVVIVDSGRIADVIHRGTLSLMDGVFIWGRPGAWPDRKVVVFQHHNRTRWGYVTRFLRAYVPVAKEEG